jgi:hypothetical protein
MIQRAFAFGLLVAFGAAASLAACTGDDTVTPSLDAGHLSDATVPEDATPAADASDAGADVLPDVGCVPFDAGPLDDAQVQAGRALVHSLGCTTCHGGTLSGNNDGVTSPETEGGLAYPPNLTSDPATGLGCWTNADIERAFLHGIDDQGQPLCPPMPRFANRGVDAGGAAEIVAYLRSLPKLVNQVPNTPQCTIPTDAGPDASESDASSGDASDGASDASDAGNVDASDASTDATGDDASDGGGDAGDAASE